MKWPRCHMCRRPFTLTRWLIPDWEGWVCKPCDAHLEQIIEPLALSILEEADAQILKDLCALAEEENS